jgi:hypothetical protein
MPVDKNKKTKQKLTFGASALSTLRLDPLLGRMSTGTIESKVYQLLQEPTYQVETNFSMHDNILSNDCNNTSSSPIILEQV